MTLPTHQSSMRLDWTLGDTVIGPNGRESTIVDFNAMFVVLEYDDDDSRESVSRSALLTDYAWVCGYDE